MKEQRSIARLEMYALAGHPLFAYDVSPSAGPSRRRDLNRLDLSRAGRSRQASIASAPRIPLCGGLIVFATRPGGGRRHL
jgi:hypothetical protein